MSLDQRMLTTFDEAICTPCKMDNPAYKTLTKTNAKNDYLLADDDLYKLSYLASSNPRRMGWSTMKLYLTKQVEARSMERWGSKEALEAERERRVLDRAKKRETRAKKAFEEAVTGEADGVFERNISKLRGELRGETADESTQSKSGKTASRSKKPKSGKSASDAATRPGKRQKTAAAASKRFVPRNETYHEHTFGPSKPTAPGSDTHVKACTQCGLEVQFESF